MNCLGKFKFKGLVQKDGGEFTNARGEKLTYKPSYQLKLDELSENGVNERIFKLPIDSPLVPELSKKRLYEDINIEFEIEFYSSGIKLTPVALKQ